MYQMLTQGLQSQQQVQNQNILESASQRGVLRSTLPVDLQTTLGQTTLQEQGKLGAQQAQDIGGIQSRIADIRLSKAAGISELSRALEAAANDRTMQRLALQQAKIAASNRGGGGGNIPQWQFNAGAIASMSQDIANHPDLKYAGSTGTGFLSPEAYKTFRRQWTSGGLSAKLFDQNFSHLANPNHLWDYGLEER